MEKEKCFKVTLHTTEWQHQHLKRLELGLSVWDPDLDDLDDLALAMGMDPVTLSDCLVVLTNVLGSAYHEEVLT